jgi:hypothetical protein
MQPLRCTSACERALHAFVGGRCSCFKYLARAVDRGGNITGRTARVLLARENVKTLF